MEYFKADSEKVEVNGQTVITIIKGLSEYLSQAEFILEKNNLQNLDPNKWYYQQDWLNAFREISQIIGNEALFRIGLAIPNYAIFPKKISRIESALKSINTAYHLNHRGGYIGYYKFNKLKDNQYQIICDNPYPPEFNRGIIEAISRKYINSDRDFSVDYNDKSKKFAEKGPVVFNVVINE